MRTSTLRPGLSLVLLALVSLAACTVIDVQKAPPLRAQVRWALLPVLNHSETAQAGERVEDLLTTLLRTQWNVDLHPYPAAKEGEPVPELSDLRRYEQAKSWARSSGFVYGVTGSVQEWRYRSGTDGEPAAGISVRVVDLATDRLIFTASGARSGWGRESVSSTAQKLLRQLLAQLSLQPPPAFPAHRQ